MARPTATVRMPDGTDHYIDRLFGRGTSNAKLARSMGGGYYIIGLSMLPYKVPGLGNVCAWASPGCAANCINISGMTHGDWQASRDILRGRLARRVLWTHHRKTFLAMFDAEVKLAVKHAHGLGLTPVCRPNVYSDVPWSRLYPELITGNPGMEFYGYTKDEKEFTRFMDGELPSNYYLTFSRSETNDDFVLKALLRGFNVAVAFDVKYRRNDYKAPLPATYEGFTVLDGDGDDLRFLDPRSKPGYVIGLRAKGRARRGETAFVVKVGSLAQVA